MRRLVCVFALLLISSFSYSQKIYTYSKPLYDTLYCSCEETVKATGKRIISMRIFIMRATTYTLYNLKRYPEWICYSIDNDKTACVRYTGVPCLIGE